MNFLRIIRGEHFEPHERPIWEECSLLVHMTSSAYSMTEEEIFASLRQYHLQENIALPDAVTFWQWIAQALAIGLLKVVPEPVYSLGHFNQTFAKCDVNARLLDAMRSAKMYVSEPTYDGFEDLKRKMDGFTL